jgi:hypothetical protein
MNFKTNIVVSRNNNNNVDFLYKINDNKDINVLIYDKETPNNELNIPVNNGNGNDASVYLKYIIDYYDDLSNFTFFIRDEEYSMNHSGSIIDKYNEAVMTNRLYYNINDKLFYGHVFGTPKDIYSQLLEWCNEYVEEYIPISQQRNYSDFIYGYRVGGQFLVHKDLIQNLPKEFYIKIYNWILTTNLSTELSNKFLELTWHVFWFIYPTEIQKKDSYIVNLDPITDTDTDNGADTGADTDTL